MFKDAIKGVKHPVFLAAAFLGLLILFFTVFFKQEVVAHNVWALGEPIGGMAAEDAFLVLQHKAEEIEKGPVVFKAGDMVFHVAPEKMQILLNVDEIRDMVNAYVEPRSRLWPSFLLKNEPRAVLATSAITEGTDIDATFKEIAKGLSCDPEDGHYGFSGKELLLISPKDGQAVSEDDVRLALMEISDSKVEVSYTQIPASEKKMNMLFLRGEYKTLYDTEEKERNVNLTLAAQAVHGVEIAPGETYSFNQAAGERTYEKGYRYANVVVGNQLVPGLAGGICQVTTTLFDAAALAGLHFPAVTAHGIPVDYVEAGFDAAVAWDYLDLKIRNNTEDSIVFGAWVEDGEVLVRVFGPPTDKSFDIETVIVETYPEAGMNPGLLVDTFLVEKAEGREISRTRIMRSRYLATEKDDPV